MSTPITNPNELVQAFKSSGEFSRLRRELLTEFQESGNIDAFKSRVEDIVKKRLLSDQKLRYLPQDTVHRELMQEVERFPVVERAVGEVPSLTDGTLLTAVQAAAQRVLLESKGAKSEPEPEPQSSPVRPPKDEPPSLEDGDKETGPETEAIIKKIEVDSSALPFPSGENEHEANALSGAANKQESNIKDVPMEGNSRCVDSTIVN